MFGMLVIRQLLGILTFLHALLLTQLLRIFNFEFAVGLLIMLGISGRLIVFFVKLARMTRFAFLFYFYFYFLFFFFFGPVALIGCTGSFPVSCFISIFLFS